MVVKNAANNSKSDKLEVVSVVIASTKLKAKQTFDKNFGGAKVSFDNKTDNLELVPDMPSGGKQLVTSHKCGSKTEIKRFDKNDESTPSRELDNISTTDENTNKSNTLELVSEMAIDVINVQPVINVLVKLKKKFSKDIKKMCQL